MRSTPVPALLALTLTLPLSAQWNPAVGQWGKTAATDLRVMTWNVRDTICSTNNKVAGANNWAAAARIVAALKPDVLLLQETADNSGNGTGSTVDTVANLTTTIGLFLHGGNDPFKSGNPPVTAYVQLYAPGYDLPYVFVSAVTDNFNRNVILSRYPFVDQNGDGRATMNDLPTLAADLYAPGGQGGIRGYMTAEIDLPDAVYAGDLVAGTCHLKAGSAASDHTQRVTAAANIAYFLDYFWNGAGTGTPDPRHKFSANPLPTAVLAPNTPIITGGDWNEDEQQNGATIGPADWITRAQVFDTATTFGSDGTDRNRTDMTYDAATDVFTGNRNSLGTFKPDHMAWQDSLCAARRAFLFNSNTLPAAAVPAELSGYPTPSSASATASDHFPLTVDFILPLALPCNSAGRDLGFAKLGGNGRFPRFSACGGLGGGQNAVLTLGDAAPLQAALLVISPAQGLLNVAGGTLVPVPPILAGPLTTDATGGLALTVPGGGAVISMWAQWAIVDPAVSFGTSFSNALRLDFRL